ncbi:MAG: hypothetical protein Q4F29_06040, partial [Lachnospiraceae bacterium]|nr:hypothetical protein [Lachnospiraceae bacterium]
ISQSSGLPDMPTAQFYPILPVFSHSVKPNLSLLLFLFRAFLLHHNSDVAPKNTPPQNIFSSVQSGTQTSGYADNLCSGCRYTAVNQTGRSKERPVSESRSWFAFRLPEKLRKSRLQERDFQRALSEGMYIRYIPELPAAVTQAE